MSQPTADKAVEVVHKIDELKEAGKVDEAAELSKTLDKSVSKAHRMAIEVGEPVAVKPSNSNAAYIPMVPVPPKNPTAILDKALRASSGD